MTYSLSSAHFRASRLERESADFVGINAPADSDEWGIFIPFSQLGELRSAIASAVGAGGMFTGPRFLIRPTNTGGRASIDISYVGGIGYLLTFLVGYLSELSALVDSFVSAYSGLDAYDLEGELFSGGIALANHTHPTSDVVGLTTTLSGLNAALGGKAPTADIVGTLVVVRGVIRSSTRIDRPHLFIHSSAVPIVAQGSTAGMYDGIDIQIKTAS